jgi:hypothetical protein
LIPSLARPLLTPDDRTRRLDGSAEVCAWCHLRIAMSGFIGGFDG